MQWDSNQVERIVSLVVQRLSDEGISGVAKTIPGQNAEKTNDFRVSLTGSSVISMEVVNGVPESAREVVIAPEAIVTPAVFDWASDHQVALLRMQSQVDSQQASPATEPPRFGWLADEHLSGAIAKDLERMGVTILPGSTDENLGNRVARQVGVGWNVIVMTRQPHRLTVELNRDPRCFAITWTSIAELSRAVGQMPVNVVTQHPDSWDRRAGERVTKLLQKGQSS